MSTAHSRRQAALDAIDLVWAGTKAEDAETELVDFKLEKGSIDHGSYKPINPKDDRAAKELAVEAACFWNSREGGVLVVGVNNEDAGPSAFLGSSLDLDWLRRRIWEWTTPAIWLDEFEIIVKGGQRIYLINVQSGYDEVRVDGKLRGRHGTRCDELTGDDAVQLKQMRQRRDWSSEPSEHRASQISQEALAIARKLYEEKRGSAPSDQELLRRMGVLVSEDSADPLLNRAGELLLCASNPHIKQLDIRVVRTESSVSEDKIEPSLLPTVVRSEPVCSLAFRVHAARFTRVA